MLLVVLGANASTEGVGGWELLCSLILAILYIPLFIPGAILIHLYEVQSFESVVALKKAGKKKGQNN